MKRVLLVLLLCTGFNLFSLDHGLISGFEVGYNIYDSNQITLEDRTFQANSSNSIFIKLTTGYKFQNLRVVGIYRNTLLQLKLDSYRPIQDYFKIDINYSWKVFFIGFSHWCSHPVVTQNDQRNVFFNSGQRAFYIKYYKEF